MANANTVAENAYEATWFDFAPAGGYTMVPVSNGVHAVVGTESRFTYAIRTTVQARELFDRMTRIRRVLLEVDQEVLEGN